MSEQLPAILKRPCYVLERRSLYETYRISVQMGLLRGIRGLITTLRFS